MSMKDDVIEAATGKTFTAIYRLGAVGFFTLAGFMGNASYNHIVSIDQKLDQQNMAIAAEHTINAVQDVRLTQLEQKIK